MKTSTKAGLLGLLGCASGLASVFEKPLGLPEWLGILLVFVAVFLVWLCNRLQRRAKERGDPSLTLLTLQEYQMRIRVLLILVVLASLASPFWLPYTGVALPFSQLVMISMVSCCICVASILFAARRHRPKVKPPDAVDGM
jgi:hypothetical protein